MTDAIAIHGHDIIDLVSQYPDGIRLSQLMDVVDERFGKSVTFHTCSFMGMDLDGLLRFWRTGPRCESPAAWSGESLDENLSDFLGVNRKPGSACS